MTTLFLVLAQTKSGAVFEIIIMLVIAGIIAFLTAYLYYKPIYTKKIDLLENEKLELEKKNSRLRTEIASLQEVIKEKENQINKLTEKERKKK